MEGPKAHGHEGAGRLTLAADAEWFVKAEITIKAETTKAETTALNLEKTRCKSASKSDSQEEKKI